MTTTKSNREILVITGGNSLIGRRLRETLGNEFNIVGLDLEEPAETAGGARSIQCDLTNDVSV